MGSIPFWITLDVFHLSPDIGCMRTQPIYFPSQATIASWQESSFRRGVFFPRAEFILRPGSCSRFPPLALDGDPLALSNAV